MAEAFDIRTRGGDGNGSPRGGHNYCFRSSGQTERDGDSVLRRRNVCVLYGKARGQNPNVVRTNAARVKYGQAFRRGSCYLRGSGFCRVSQRCLRTRDGRGSWIHNFDFEFSGGSHRQQENKARENAREPHAPSFSRERGLVWTVRAGLLAWRVRISSGRLRPLISGYRCRPSQDYSW